MSVTDDGERLSPHLKYAITKNAILWKGEHQQKLKAINQDYQMKADEIWHNRTQAARDYVIDVLNQNSTTSKSNARISASRDREAMQRIQELSDLYLSQAMMQKVNTKRLRQSLVETSKKQSQSFFLTQQTFDNPTPPLPNIRDGESNKREIWKQRKNSMKGPSEFDSFDFGSRRNVQTQQSSRTARGFFDKELSGDSLRPSTTSATLPIRRTSCRLSNTAKSLLELQRMQQRQRLSISSNRVLPAAFLTSASATKVRKNPTTAIPAAVISKDFQNEQTSVEVDMKIKGFCDRLAQSAESQQWKKYNSKWSVLREYVRTASTGAKRKIIAEPAAETDHINTTEEFLRKPSVHWSDPIASLGPNTDNESTSSNYYQ